MYRIETVAMVTQIVVPVVTLNPFLKQRFGQHIGYIMVEHCFLNQKILTKWYYIAITELTKKIQNQS